MQVVIATIGRCNHLILYLRSTIVIIIWQETRIFRNYWSINNTQQLAQLCNPTAKGSSKVPGLFRFFWACIFVSPVPAPEIETQQIRCWELQVFNKMEPKRAVILEEALLSGEVLRASLGSPQLASAALTSACPGTDENQMARIDWHVLWTKWQRCGESQYGSKWGIPWGIPWDVYKPTIFIIWLIKFVNGKDEMIHCEILGFPSFISGNI